MQTIQAFIAYVLKLNPQYGPLDTLYLQNRILGLIGEDHTPQETADEPLALLDALVATAVLNHQIADTFEAQDRLGATLMDLATPAPSVVNAQFWATYQKDPKQAILDFFTLSRANNYIQTRAIAKNQAFDVATDYGDLQITINLSKPEKDPKEIAAAAQLPQRHYPQCQLCMENEGYLGRPDYPARQNHRIIRFELGDQTWGFQYSPYAYFNEHAIFLDGVHEPMHISRATFEQLMTILDRFPGYFVGSNADLPIVGGSMLSHEHYQGGHHVFPMDAAKTIQTFELPHYPQVTAETIKWPLTVIRLTSDDPTALIGAAEQVRKTWATYTDLEVDVIAADENGPHHTITPIARKIGDRYQLDLTLRDNHTSAQYPDGVFHPHQDVQHIKKENIGLIEVMGLAILPGRLIQEMTEVENYLVDRPSQVAPIHQPWAAELKQQGDWHSDTVHQRVQQAIGQVFARVLEDAGVFKWDEAGRAASARFIQALVAE